MRPRTSVLISDFDGTITDNEFYALITGRYMPRETPDFFGGYQQGKITHFEALKSVFAYAPEEEEELARLLQDTKPDPQLAAAIACLETNGWDVVVTSAGSAWYIERILAAAGVDVPVHASPGRIEKGQGLVMDLPYDSPFYSPQNGIDKEALVRSTIERSERVAFAGDGPLDFAPAMLVEPRYRFARRWLARDLKRKGIPFHEFQRWSEIAGVLTGGCPGLVST